MYQLASLYKHNSTHLVSQDRRPLVDVIANQPSNALGLIIAKLISTVAEFFVNELTLILCNLLISLFLRSPGVFSEDLVEAAFLFFFHLFNLIEFQLGWLHAREMLRRHKYR